MARMYVDRNPTGRPHVVWGWIAVALVPALVIGGFVFGTLLIGDPNAPTAPQGWDGAWRVLVLWAGLEVVPLLGMAISYRGLRSQEAGARQALLANGAVFLFFVAVTLVGGLSDVLG